MKITIAGASSFIGKRLLNKVAGEDVVAIVREGSQFTWPGVKIIHCNMEEYGRLGELCGAGDVFIDLAWRGSRGADRQNHEMQKMNYKSTIDAMKSMADVGYKTLISAGSQAEYGLCSGVITEETPTNPNTEYGVYKLRIFNEVSKIAEKYDCRFIEPRYFSLYGPGDYEKTLIMATLRKLLSGDRIELNDCTQLWDYMFVDDAMDALVRLYQSDLPGGVYNFATGEHRQLKDFILDMKDAVESKSEIAFGVIPYNGLYIDLRPDVAKLKSTGWIQRTTFKEGIRKAAETL